MSEPFELKLGLKRPLPSEPRPRLSSATGAVLPSPPEVHWAAGVPAWTPLGNLDHADCAEAAVGHEKQTLTWNIGKYYAPTTATILKAYADITGWDPVTNANDNGTYMGDLIQYMKTKGINGHKWDAVVVLNNWFNPKVVLGAIFNFGVAHVALSLPDDYAKQFYAKEPFHKTGPANPENGHLVACSGASVDMIHCNSWGAQKAMLFEFIPAYAYGVYVPFSSDWVKPSGLTPSGLTRGKAMAYLRSLGTLI